MQATLVPKPRIMSIWRILLVCAAMIPAFLCSLFLRPLSFPWILVTCIWAALFLFIYLFYLPARLRALSLKVEDERFILTTGVFYRITRTAPFKNIQFLTLRSSPLHRHWELATLVIVSPGGRMVMPGLEAAQARLLSEVLFPEG